MNNDIVFCNYQPMSGTVSPEMIPTLIPEEKLQAIVGNDIKPFFKIESIEYPVKGTGGIYTESFFKSFVSVMNDRPIPGSKRGHTWQSRPTSDLYTIGGKLEENGNGTGVVHLKVYIPNEGDSDSNTGLIRDAKANIVHFSLVTMPEFEMKIDEHGNENIFFTASKGYERNDAVEYGAGAMHQTVNAVMENGIIRKSVTNAKKLINAGTFDDTSAWSFSGSDGNKLLGENGDDWANFALWHMYEDTEASPETKARYKYPYGKNGKVYRSALRAIASRAAQQGLDDLSNTASDLLSLMDDQRKSSNKGVRKVNTKEEALNLLKNMKENGDVTLKEIAAHIGLEGKVVTEKHENALNVITELEKLGCKDPVKEYSEMKNTIDSTEKDRVENRIKKEFDPNGLGEKNNLLTYANKILAEKSMDELEDAIKDFKEDPIAKKFAAENAATFSDVNTIGIVDNNGKPVTDFSGSTLVL